MKTREFGFLLLVLAIGLVVILGCGAPPPTPTPPRPPDTPTATATSESVALLTPTTTLTVTVEPSDTPTATPCLPPEGWVPYTVGPGENLFRIALAYDMTAEALGDANCLPSTDEIQVGQVIYVPYYITPTPTLPPSPTPCFVRSDWVPYVVRPEDNLYRLAVRYGLSVWDLQSGNCLDSDLLLDGQILYVPYLIPTVAPTSTPPRGEVAQPPFSVPLPPPPGGTSDCEEELCYEFECNAFPWITYTYASGGTSASCADNQLEVSVAADSPGITWDAGWTLPNAWIYAEAARFEGPGASEYGVLCGYQDERTYYAFLINDEGRYTILRMADGQRTDLGTGLLSEAFESESPNRLLVTCSPSELTLSVNEMDPPITVVDPNPLSDGRVGLAVGGSGEDSIVIRFERLSAGPLE